ncbi:MAG: hypothetical protein ABFC30_02795 [Proteiniphilum sp.]
MDRKMEYRAMTKAAEKVERKKRRTAFTMAEMAKALGICVTARRAMDLRPGDQIYDMETRQWESVKEVSINSKYYGQESIAWVHVQWVGLFAMDAMVKRFAHDDKKFYVKG